MPLPAKNDSFFHPFAGFGFRKILVVEDDISVNGDPFSSPALLLDTHINDQTGKAIHQCGFPGAVRADHPDNLTIVYLHGQIVNGQRIFEENH